MGADWRSAVAARGGGGLGGGKPPPSGNGECRQGGQALQSHLAEAGDIERLFGGRGRA